MSTFPPTAGFIDSLDPANPINADFVYGADDWFRFVQQVLTNQFPTSEDDSANGYDIAVTSKASELNTLDGIDTGTDLETRLSNIEAQLDVIEPIGTIKPWPIKEGSLTQTLSGSLAPGRGTWHLCDGSTLDGSTTYATLYTLIANQYGGTGAADMQIPKTEGRVIAGRGTGALLTGYRQGVNDNTQGNTGGEEKHTPVLGEMYGHNHGGGAHTHLVGDRTGGGGSQNILDYTASQVQVGSTNVSIITSGTIINSEGSNEDSNIVQPTIILAFYMRVL